MRTETMVRQYKSTDDYRKDAQKLSRNGWTVKSVESVEQRAGCLRFFLIGPLSLIFKPKPRILVTYERELVPKS